MGTAVLFPQDCFRPQIRHNHLMSEMMYASECASIRRNPLPRTQSQEEAGLLPLPGQSGHTSSNMSIPRRAPKISHFKCRKGAEQRGIDHSSRTVSDAPAYKLLQRPKQRDAAVNVLAQFVVLGDAEARPAMIVENTLNKIAQNVGGIGEDTGNDCVKVEFGMLDVRREGVKRASKASGIRHARGGNKIGSVEETKNMCTFPNGVRTSIAEVRTSIAEVYKLSSAKGKPKNVLNDTVRGMPSKGDSKLFVTKASGKATDVSCKSVSIQGSEELHKLPCLRRTSTEPQIINKHALHRYESNVIHVSFQKSKSVSYTHDRGLFANTSSLSSEERWAGPAYTSSPSPSSLPIPRLCLPQTRFASVEIPPRVKQYPSSVDMQPIPGSSAPCEKGGGAWDVAFATKSLRKMLNLDPC